MNEMKCSSCKVILQPYESVSLQIKNGYQLLCLKCYNEIIANQFGIPFEHISFNPITLKDNDGINHTFCFRTQLLGDRVIIDAIEQLNNDKQGYELSAIGDVEEDLFDLFKVLFERIRRALSRKHIEPCEITPYRITQQDIVRGHITSAFDVTTDEPLLVIDGKEICWNEFGKMLSTFEGFNFKLEIFDKTEEK